MSKIRRAQKHASMPHNREPMTRDTGAPICTNQNGMRDQNKHHSCILLLQALLPMHGTHTRVGPPFPQPCAVGAGTTTDTTSTPVEALAFSISEKVIRKRSLRWRSVACRQIGPAGCRPFSTSETRMQARSNSVCIRRSKARWSLQVFRCQRAFPGHEQPTCQKMVLGRAKPKIFLLLTR